MERGYLLHLKKASYYGFNKIHRGTDFAAPKGT